jgi:hypothetical protein
MRWLTLPEYISRAREAIAPASDKQRKNSGHISRAREAIAEKEQRKNKERTRKETGNVANETTTKL